jgi:catechol 2,3-dioxygenase-like lactoylglutathione lyase family enzyme
MKEFNHITREVLNLELSTAFYCKVLGFVLVPRPAFESVGNWLWGHGLSLHLIQTEQIRDRQAADAMRLIHYKGMPIADHFAFLVDNVQEVQDFLDKHGIFYYHDNNTDIGIYQIFIFDPDHNVIELSNCAPPVGEIKCLAAEHNESRQICKETLSGIRIDLGIDYAP